MAIGLEDYVENLGFILVCGFMLLVELQRHYPLHLVMLGMFITLMVRPRVFDKLKRVLTSISIMFFLWNIILITEYFHFCKDCSHLFDKLQRALVGIDISDNLILTEWIMLHGLP